ncbi:hypothetical protein J6590_099832 [Homalodisca vitripennis]|nr:hypothetical protein J6590_099832 [Homalodisca vitripennis]
MGSLRKKKKRTRDSVFNQFTELHINQEMDIPNEAKDLNYLLPLGLPLKLGVLSMDFCLKMIEGESNWYFIVMDSLECCAV